MNLLSDWFLLLLWFLDKQVMCQKRENERNKTTGLLKIKTYKINLYTHFPTREISRTA
jgi:hypothetical protein